MNKIDKIEEIEKLGNEILEFLDENSIISLSTEQMEELADMVYRFEELQDEATYILEKEQEEALSSNVYVNNDKSGLPPKIYEIQEAVFTELENARAAMLKAGNTYQIQYENVLNKNYPDEAIGRVDTIFAGALYETEGEKLQALNNLSLELGLDQKNSFNENEIKQISLIGKRKPEFLRLYDEVGHYTKGIAENIATMMYGYDTKEYNEYVENKLPKEPDYDDITREYINKKIDELSILADQESSRNNPSGAADLNIETMKLIKLAAQYIGDESAILESDLTILAQNYNLDEATLSGLKGVKSCYNGDCDEEEAEKDVYALNYELLKQKAAEFNRPKEAETVSLQ